MTAVAKLVWVVAGVTLAAVVMFILWVATEGLKE